MIANLTEREKELLSLLADDSSLSVNEISKHLSVSVVTTRNDLSNLAEKGYIIRTRGGAAPTFHPTILERQKHMIEAKNRIAKAAASMIEDNDRVMIEAGTTTALIAKYLLGKRDVHIVTNSALILPYARVNPSIHLTMVGGEFRACTESLVGSLSLRELSQFHVTYAFVGTDGFTLKHGLTTHLAEGAEIVRKMAEQAEKTILVADSTKYNKTGFARVLPISAIDTMITDIGLDADVIEELEEGNITVKIV
jgi:DeoR family galactitol utilization operon repressor